MDVTKVELCEGAFLVPRLHCFLEVNQWSRRQRKESRGREKLPLGYAQSISAVFPLEEPLSSFLLPENPLDLTSEGGETYLYNKWNECQEDKTDAKT